MTDWKLTRIAAFAWLALSVIVAVGDDYELAALSFFCAIGWFGWYIEERKRKYQAKNHKKPL